MADFRAIYAVGESLRAYLVNKAAYRSDLPKFDIQLISSGRLAETDELNNTLTLLLHRVSINEHLRNTQQRNGTSNSKPPLALDLHYLMTVWADSAVNEQLVLAWAMEQLHQHSSFGASSLSSQANWGIEEIQITPVDLNSEEIMRIWDRLEPSYRLSVAYVASVVRIESDRPIDSRPVVATRFNWQEQASPQEQI